MGFGELSHRRLELGVSPPRPALLGPGWRPWCRHSESVSGAQGACSLPLTALCLPPVRSVGQGPQCRMPCPLAVAQGPQITPSGGSSPSWSCLRAPLAGGRVGGLEQAGPGPVPRPESGTHCSHYWGSHSILVGPSGSPQPQHDPLTWWFCGPALSWRPHLLVQTSARRGACPWARLPRTSPGQCRWLRAAAS